MIYMLKGVNSKLARLGSLARCFGNPASPERTALRLERYRNYGLSMEELQSD